MKIRLLTSLSNPFSNQLWKLKFPEKLKGGHLEKWAKYWVDVKKDYKESVIEIMKDCKRNPIKTSVCLVGLGTLCFAIKKNHALDDFQDTIQRYMNDSALLGDKIRNKAVDKHFNFLVECSNHDLIRRLNLGFFSLVWIDNYPSECGMFKAQCSYLKPRYVTFHDRIIDVGFFGTWWNIRNKFKNFDVNDEEWLN